MAPAEVVGAPDGPLIDVEVVQCAGRGQLEHHRLSLPAGSSLQDALAACGWWPRPGTQATGPDDLRDDDADASPPGVGVWGRLAGPERILVQGDRVEVYRALQVEPKEARRLRHRRQRALSAQAKARVRVSGPPR